MAANRCIYANIRYLTVHYFYTHAFELVVKNSAVAQRSANTTFSKPHAVMHPVWPVGKTTDNSSDLIG